MVELKCTRFDYSGVPILSDAEIDRFAYTVLTDYKPELLEKPGKIDFSHFIEFYLEANLSYQDIYNDDPEKPIFGMAVFHEGMIKVFDRKSLSIEEIWVDNNTIVLDNYVMEEGKEGLALFTGLHECGHFIFDYDTYNNMDYHNENASAILCRQGNIENFSSRKYHRTPSEWREHHADYFAAGISMPNTTFIPFINRKMREYFYYKPQVIIGENEETDYLAEVVLPQDISETYGVSKRAAYIKLIKCGFIIDNGKRNKAIYWK